MGKHLPSRENIAKEDLVDILRLDTSTLNSSYIVELVYRSFCFHFLVMWFVRTLDGVGSQLNGGLAGQRAIIMLVNAQKTPMAFMLSLLLTQGMSR